MFPDKIKNTHKRFRSIRFTITAVFLSLSISILLLSMIMQVFFNFTTQQKVVANQLNIIAEGADSSIKNFIQNNINILSNTADMNGLLTATDEEKKLVLSNLLGHNRAFNNLFIIDKNWRQSASVSKLASIKENQITPEIKSGITHTMQKGDNYISSVYVGPLTNEPLIFVSVPIYNSFRESKMALVAVIDLKSMWNLAGSIQVGKNGSAYVVDGNGNLIAYRDTSMVLAKENLSGLSEVNQFVNHKVKNNVINISKGINGDNVVATRSDLGVPNWSVIVEMPIIEAYSATVQMIIYSFFIILAAIILVFLFGSYISRKITKDIIYLNSAVEKISGGKLDQKILIDSPNEIGQLANAFNTMTGELKLSRLKLQESEQKYRVVADYAQDWETWIGLDNKFIYVSPSCERITGYKSDEFYKDFSLYERIVYSDDREIFEKHLKEIRMENAPDARLEFRIVTRNGEMRWIEHICGNIFGTDGKWLGQRSNNRDITERKKMEEQLKELDKLKDDFLMITTHELKTPLVPIKSQCQLILAGDYGKINKKQKEAIEMIYRNEEVLGALTSEVMDVAKIKSGKMQIMRVPSQLEKIVANVVADLKTAAERKHITLSLDTMPELPKMFIDESRIRQALANLIDNAIKFTPGNGTIKVDVQREKGIVSVAVSDTGIGISAKNIPKLFTPFFQAESDVTHKQRGTGLGLAISKGLVEAHGGTISVKSAGEGKGSTFIVTLPLVANQKREQ
jgi:PAS domain S-box-containing protein